MSEVIVIPDVWLGVIAALIPLLTALTVKSTSSNNVRAAVAAVATVILAVVEQVVANSFTIEGLLSTFGVAMIVQLTAYVALWKPLVNVNEKAPDTKLSVL